MVHFIGVTEGNIENLEKENKMRISILLFILIIHFFYLKVYTKFENSCSNRSRKFCYKKIHWREKKELIK